MKIFLVDNQRKFMPGFLLLVLFIGLAFPAMAGEQKLHRDGVKKFSVKYPADWEPKEGEYGTTFMALSPVENETDAFRENFNIVYNEYPTAYTLEDYFDASLEGLKKFLTDFQVLDKGKAVINNRESRWIMYLHRMGEIKVKVKQYFFVNGKRTYILTFSAEPNSYERFHGHFEAIAASFQVD
jgi:serine/threonine-protein kinase